jgi:hypothetical protein
MGLHLHAQSPVSQTRHTTLFPKGETFAFIRPIVDWLLYNPGHDYDLAWQLTNAMMDSNLLSLDNHVVVYSDSTLVGFVLTLSLSNLFSFGCFALVGLFCLQVTPNPVSWAPFSFCMHGSRSQNRISNK